MEFELEPSPPSTDQCRPAMPGRVRCSLAIHPKHGVAIVSCYHGVAFMASGCPCGTNHKAILIVEVNRVPGLQVSPPARFIGIEVNPYPIDPAERDRDVAWFTCPPKLQGLRARPVATGSVGLDELVEVQTSFGPFFHQVVGLPSRGSHDELLLSQDRLPRGDGSPSSFTPGQSGSPVLNRSGELVAVVRDKAGHCGRVVV